jgi:integrase
MARKVRDAALDSPAARSKLKPRGRPYWRTIERGVHLGYRRLKGRAGTWCMRRYIGEQNYKVEGIGAADDLSDADGVEVLDYWQAVEKVRECRKQHAHKADGQEPTVLTVRTSVEEYVAERDARETRRRRGRPVRSDAHRLGRYVIGREQNGKRKAIAATALADVPLPVLDEDGLQQWRNNLPGTLTSASKQRTINDLKAALNAAYARHRKNLHPSLPGIIKHGLMATSGHDDEAEPVARDNQILDDAKITRLLRAAKRVDAERHWDGHLYRLIVVLYATGARFSQVARLRVGDCQIDRKRLLVPKSRKGRGKSGSTPVPVEQGVIDTLLPVIAGRASDAPLLERWRHRQTKGGKWERAECAAWQSSSEFDRAWDVIRERAKMPDVIPYALRHSSIVRGLRANLPIRLVAALHDTSVQMIERHYAKWIVDGLEELAAQALVPLLPRFGDEEPSNVRRLLQP